MIGLSLSTAPAAAAPPQRPAAVAPPAAAGEKVDTAALVKATTEAGSKAAARSPSRETSPEELARQVQEMQAKLDKLNPELAFVVDAGSGRAVIQLTDRATREVIQQYPSEAARQISRALDRFANGHLVHKTA